MDCIFCKIINKEIHTDIVYENDFVIAFNDIHPVAPVHVLIMPKQHIANANEITLENSSVLNNIFLAIKEIAKITGVEDTGYRVITNCGSDAGQIVHHLHFHILGGKSLGPKLMH